MRVPLNITSIDQRLLEDVIEGKVVFFVGSNYLMPPRSAHMEAMMDHVDRERSISKAKDTLGKRVVTLGREEYSDLDEFISDIWPISMYQDLQLLVQKLKKTKFLITSIFDANIERALKEDKRIFTLRGKDSMDEEKMAQAQYADFVLYQLVGSTKKPETLCLDTTTMYSLRDKLRRSSLFRKFYEYAFRNKSLIIIGYDSKDLYDNFFRELINDYFENYEKSLLDNIYFVDKPDYRKYYGIWEDKEEDKLNVIPLLPKDFIKKLSGGIK